MPLLNRGKFSKRWESVADNLRKEATKKFTGFITQKSIAPKENDAVIQRLNTSLCY
jgi:hypothetical protein